MEGKDVQDSTEVVICGFGPTGAMLSALLSQYSVPHVVIEKDADINVDPRGIALDEDGIRCLQACGVYEEVFTKIGQCMGNFRFVGGRKPDLSREPFMEMAYGTTEGGTGHPGFLCHKQPEIERTLRSRINSLGVARVHLGSRVTHIEEDRDRVYVTYIDQAGKTHTVSGLFLVAADGKTGFTRKQYLEPRGISMQQIGTVSYDKEWVALNWRISLPTPETHPNFPLWAKGYTPEQVYDAFFPSDFRFLCNPDRASVCGRFGLNQDRLWRFEFVVLPGEDSIVMAAPEQIARVVHPYITHPGSRYGLGSKSIIYPLDCIEVLRCRPFRFSARSCNKWALGRVILCGDAAHVFPPFGGQGIASGFRDALSLAWRLAIAIRTLMNKEAEQDHAALFQGWHAERKQQLNKSLASTVRNGEYVTEANPLRVFIRDWWLWLVQMVPSWRHTMRLGNRAEGLTRFLWEDGKNMAFVDPLSGGLTIPQVYAVPLSSGPGNTKISFTDDVIFSAGKRGLFQAIIVASSGAIAGDLRAAAKGLSDGSGGLVREEEITTFRDGNWVPEPGTSPSQVYRFAHGTEFAVDKLCRGRPEPIGYDPLRLVNELGRDKVVIVRPDRVVFAVCNDRSEMMLAAGKLQRLKTTGRIE